MSDIKFDPASAETFDPPRPCEVYLNGHWQPTEIYAWMPCDGGGWEGDVKMPDYNGNPPTRDWVPAEHVRPVTPA